MAFGGGAAAVAVAVDGVGRVVGPSEVHGIASADVVDDVAATAHAKAVTCVDIDGVGGPVDLNARPGDDDAVGGYVRGDQVVVAGNAESRVVPRVDGAVGAGDGVAGATEEAHVVAARAPQVARIGAAASILDVELVAVTVLGEGIIGAGHGTA